VYIAQLHRRAVILDRHFKSKVIASLNSHKTEDAEGQQVPVPTIDSEPAVLEPPGSSGERSAYSSTCAHQTLQSSAATWQSSAHAKTNEVSESEDDGRRLSLEFVAQGQSSVHVEIYFGRIKRQIRMREKIAKYLPPYPRSQWPLTGHITDPVRLAIVCSDPAGMMEVSLSLPLSLFVPLCLPPSPFPLSPSIPLAIMQACLYPPLAPLPLPASVCRIGSRRI
jgi:hypothetical protein